MDLVDIKPRPRGFSKDNPADPAKLAAGRYGTKEMCEIWGPEKTFEYSLRAQAVAAETLAELGVIPKECAKEISEKANLKYIKPERIRELEEQKGHDVIAINTALEEVLSRESASHVNKAKTSADTTQPARALQLKDSLDVIMESVENLRNILIEKAVKWIDVPHMDTTHLYDALPTVAGRPFAHYAEMLQSNLDVLRFVYKNSLIGKWGDATGNHHSADSYGIDGRMLQEKYCEKLGLKWMDASAQLPGLEFEADVVFAMARTAETINNIAKYIAWGRSDDVNIFINASPQKKKGSSAMPHKDAKNGNPTAEEQFMSIRNYMMGNLMTAMANCEMPYARNLAASANSRINFEDGFKFLDHGIRSMANIAYWLELDKERCIERVKRSYGVVTSQLVMNCLTDHRKMKNPMTRSEAHDLVGRLATEAWQSKTLFFNVLRMNKEITDRIGVEILKGLTNPLNYIGQSKDVIRNVYSILYHEAKKR